MISNINQEAYSVDVNVSEEVVKNSPESTYGDDLSDDYYTSLDNYYSRFK